ncbi:phage regulatory CII family protein [Acinetobacter gerneri]|uniref:phage regulatory CII family protein n=1 Tax=Acinetobacter gerneri TaxID=202952 RepID=UPI003215FDC3
MNEINLSREAKNALYKMVHQTTGIEPKDIAEVLGDSHKTILNYANPNMDQHLPSLKKIEAMLMYTRNPVLLKVWAHKLGLMLVPAKSLDDKGHEASVVEALLHVNSHTGQINQQVIKALEDGVITPAELADTDVILEEMENHIHELRNAMKTETAKYLSALQKEKA